MRNSRLWKTARRLTPLALACALSLASGCAGHALPAIIHPDSACDEQILKAYDRLMLGYDLDRETQIELEACALDYATRLNCGQGMDTEGCKRFNALGRES